MRNHWLAVLSAAVVFFAATAFAEQHGRNGGAAPSRPGTPTEADGLDVETVDGVVASIDARTGALALKTETGLLTMRVPPRWVAKVKQGDHLKLAMALEPSPPPAQDSDKKTLALLLLMLSAGRGAR